MCLLLYLPVQSFTQYPFWENFNIAYARDYPPEWKYKQGGNGFTSNCSKNPLLLTKFLSDQISCSVVSDSLRLTSIESMMPSSQLILCCPLLLLPPIPPSIRVFSNESTLRMRWPTYWSFSFSIIPSKEIPGLISLQSKGLSRVFSNTTVQKHQFFGAQLSSQSNSHIHT